MKWRHVIDVNEIVTKLLITTNNFILKHVKEGPYITVYEARIWFTEMVDAAITGQCFWSTCDTRPYEKSIEKHFPWLTFSPTDDNLSNKFIVEVLDIIEVAANDIAIKVIPNRTWKIWSVKRIAGMLIFEEGIDYRIKEWHRLNPKAPRG